MQTTSSGFEGRSTYIDALRGIAAFGVACYHIARYEPLKDAGRAAIPGPLLTLIDHGWVGVQVFFVISGFVIAYSVRRARVTPLYLANYALRRSVRLDPPYWVTMAFVLLLHATLHLHLGWESPLDVPSKFETPVTWRLIALHVTYLQDICGFENLSAGFWSLCIEVQFYLLYVMGLGLAQCLPARNRRSPADASPWSLTAIFTPLAVLSLFEWNRTVGGVSAYDNEMWIIRFFAMFYLGMSVWWTLDGRLPAWAFWAYVVAFLARIAQQVWLAGWNDKLSIALTVALVAGLSILAAGRRGSLGTWLKSPVLQYLGRISYSLYLIHFPISHVVKWTGVRLSGPEPHPLIAGSWLMLSLATSVVAAHFMYRWIEAPSVRWAARLKRS